MMQFSSSFIYRTVNERWWISDNWKEYKIFQGITVLLQYQFQLLFSLQAFYYWQFVLLFNNKMSNYCSSSVPWNIKQILTFLTINWTFTFELPLYLSGKDGLKMELIKWIKSDRPNFIITLEWQAHPLIIAATKWKLFIKSCAGQFSNILIFSQVVKKIHKMSSLNVYILYFTSPWILSSIKTIS